jgi:integration host factor subunit beta
MTKSDLIKAVSIRYPNLDMENVAKIVNSVFEQMTLGLCDGKRIELRGFGSFSIRTREKKEVRNPRTNAVTLIGERKVPYYRMGKECKDRINNQDLQSNV